MPVIPAAARPSVEQAAADVGEIDVFGLLLLQLEEAATAAAVAEAFPLRLVHLFQALCAPERTCLGHAATAGRVRLDFRLAAAILPRMLRLDPSSHLCR